MRMTPYPSEQLFVCQRPSGRVYKNAKQIPFEPSEVYRNLTSRHGRLGEIDRKVTYANWPFRCRRVCRVRPPELCPNPGLQLCSVERFRHVVIRAGIQQTDFLPVGITRRYNDDRRHRPSSDLAANCFSRDIGKAEVEHDEPWLMRRSEINGIFARASFDHLGEDLLERIPDHAPDLRSVVYDERGVGLSSHRPLPEAGPAIKMKPPIKLGKKERRLLSHTTGNGVNFA